MFFNFIYCCYYILYCDSSCRIINVVLATSDVNSDHTLTKKGTQARIWNKETPILSLSSLSVMELTYILDMTLLVPRKILHSNEGVLLEHVWEAMQDRWSTGHTCLTSADNKKLVTGKSFFRCPGKCITQIGPYDSKIQVSNIKTFYRRHFLEYPVCGIAFWQMLPNTDDRRWDEISEQPSIVQMWREFAYDLDECINKGVLSQWYNAIGEGLVIPVFWTRRSFNAEDVNNRYLYTRLLMIKQYAAEPGEEEGEDYEVDCMIVACSSPATCAESLRKRREELSTATASLNCLDAKTVRRNKCDCNYRLE